MSELIQFKRSTFRKGTILLYAFFLSLIAYIFAPQILTPKPGEQSLRCATAHWYVGLARAAGQNCTTKCTNWEAADCNGFSPCYNKNISCVNGVDQDGRSCKGCCFDCVVVCEPDPDKPPSISGSVSCGQWGNNGWCISTAQLKLDASDPQGYDLSITGNAKSTSISCNGNCSIDLPTGSGVANYVVTASQSGISASGSTDWAYDPDSPNIGLDINGSSGRNGWYRSQTLITPIGSDSNSGLAGVFVSVNNGAWQTSATLNDGIHHIAITASDNAGNIVNSSTIISVDTTTPSISISTKGKASKNGWYVSSPTISASASDSMSGIASLEFSVDGNSYQPYSSPISFSNGRHTIQFRATDEAGNTTETPVQTLNVDLTPPSVSLSTSSTVGYVITYKAHDDESGLSAILVVLEDRENGSQKISWDESVPEKSASGKFNWDGKFLDGTEAHPGEYLVWIKAVDKAGNQSRQFSRIVISDSGSSSTPDEISQNDDILLPTDSFESDEASATTDLPELTYGGSPTKPTESSNQSLSLSASAGSTSNNPFPWWLVAGATVAAGATTYEATISKKSRAQREATRARIRAEREAEREAKRDAQARVAKASKLEMQLLKTGRTEAKENIEWEKAVVARKKAQKEAQTKAGLEAYYNARKQGEKVSPTPTNWWEETKSLTNETIIQPLNTNIIQPYVNPALEKTKEVISNGTSWINENVYQPYIEPVVTQTKQTVSNGIAWVNENIYQPYIKPIVEKTIETFTDAISWTNTNIIQPYVQPVFTTVNEKIYQPYVKPLLETTKEIIEDTVSWINENIYQPYVQPIVSYIDENIYQPYLKPVVDDVKALQQKIWDKYGELVHGSLDAVGLIPGLGEIADGLNGLIYLGEGRYVEAGIAALAMIPILGDLGKAGKWGLKVGQEIVEEAVEKVAKEVTEEVVEKVVKETLEEATEKVAKETLEAATEKTIKETAEEMVEKAAKETTAELSEKVAREMGEELAEKTTKVVVEKATKEAADEAATKVVKETVAPVSTIPAKKVSQTVAEETTEEALEQASKVTPQFIKSLEEKYGEEAVSKFLPFCEKYGINPYDVLTRPPAEGQTLIGWGLGIDNLKNPVNHPLMQLNLTKDELNNILEKSIVNPDSKVVVLGYGSNVARPYYQLGEDIKGCYLSLSKEAWAPFDNARANFWTDINAPFLEKAIKERKVFLFNIESDVIKDPKNIERFSLPELNLIEMTKNNYVEVPVKEGYTAFVPSELLETYEEYLPVNLL